MVLHIRRWCLWQAQTTDQALLITADAAGACRTEIEGRPQLATIAPIQRRRLSPLARVVFETLSHCATPHAQEVLVFSSVLGEIQRTQTMLEAIANETEVSPATFSLSVHNAIGGLWSQLQGIKAPMIALAPTTNSPVPALLEGAGVLLESTAQGVNIVCAAENQPAFYDPWISSPVGPSALALHLDASARDCALSLRLQPLDTNDHSHRCNSNSYDNMTAFIQLLTNQEDHCHIRESHCHWQLERLP